MATRINSLTLITKSAAAKLALGAASLMVLTVVGSATIAGATPVEGTTKEKEGTSLRNQREKDDDSSDKKENNKNKDKDHKDHQNNKNKPHHKNNGNHGYGGGNNNAVNTDLTINQSGSNNVLSVIIKYIFG